MFLSVCVHGVIILCVHANHQSYGNALLKMCVIIGNGYYGRLTMTSEMPVKNLLEILMLFREKTGLKLETTLYDNFAVLSNNKFKIIVMGREKRADDGEND